MVKIPLESFRWRGNIGPKIKRPVDSCALRNLDLKNMWRYDPASAPQPKPVLFPAIISLISPLSYTRTTGWFCRQEWKLEKHTGIPLRLRLGSPDHVDWLEQKPNAIKPR